MDICRFHEAHGYPISGCFEIVTRGMDGVRAWFEKSPLAQGSLMPFGVGATGDIYAIWLTNGLLPDSSPVIILGSEGELDVLAVNTREFCRLLCLGYSELGLDDIDSIPTDFDETKPFRDFMLKKYQFDLPATARPIVDEARSQFPDFKGWVAEHQI